MLWIIRAAASRPSQAKGDIPTVPSVLYGIRISLPYSIDEIPNFFYGVKPPALDSFVRPRPGLNPCPSHDIGGHTCQSVIFRIFALNTVRAPPADESVSPAGLSSALRSRFEIFSR